MNLNADFVSGYTDVVIGKVTPELGPLCVPSKSPETSAEVTPESTQKPTPTSLLNWFKNRAMPTPKPAFIDVKEFEKYSYNDCNGWGAPFEGKEMSIIL